MIAILAILATLLMATLSSAKRKAWQAVCTSNLHQIGIVLNLYLEDNPERPTNLLALVTSKYLPTGQVLRCPADRPSASSPAAAPTTSVVDASGTLVPAPRVSYRDPLAWPDEQWNKLMQLQTRAGIAVCTWHNVAVVNHRNQCRPRHCAHRHSFCAGQLDGTVVRRQVYPTTASNPVSSLAAPSQSADPSKNAGGNSGPTPDPPWEFFSDDPR